MECRLCDTIKVVFPFYNTTGQFKIVKTVWDVLQDRYESMELGDLSVTLAEALGVSSESNRTSDMTDFVVAQGTDGIWTYKKWNSGDYHAWYEGTINLGAGSAMGGGYFHTSSSTLTPPSFSQSVSSLVGGNNGALLYTYVGHSAEYETYWWNGVSSAANGVPVRLDMYGKWK